MDFSAQQIATFVQGEIVGDANATVNTFAKIEEGKPGCITFLANPKYAHYIYDTEASIVLVNRDFVPEKPIKATLIKVDNAYETLAKLMMLYEQSKTQDKGIASTAVIAESAQVGKDVFIGAYVVIDEGAVIGDNTSIYPHTYVGKNVRIGDSSIIYSGVNIYHDCQIGNHVILHSGVVIGADGFGFAPTPEGYNKIPQIGNVIIEDNVEIGANTCVDRATMGSTIIHKGVKLDNLIQVAHNVVVGANTVMAAQVGIAGSAKLGEWCVIAGQVGISGHLNIGNHVTLGPKTGILSSIQDGKTLIGSLPAEGKAWFRQQALVKKLPDMYRELNALRKELDELKKDKTN
ncbi:MAG: UDP-3-O-(3-hydroxymyristoyl)glucosamine N-acyltransferase [Bacteroidaceae bacterium]|nr:UDP-3-O-(3-hydroxymyristoyl)glucosamine N-acyltransferase [Bacteroidaceae bacterium]